MKRREFLKYTSAGIATAAYVSKTGDAQAQTVCGPCKVGTAATPDISFDLAIMDHRMMMIDGTFVNVLGFKDLADTARFSPRVPGPVLRVKSGSIVKITIHNQRREMHGFEITGVPASKTQVAALGCCSVTFTAPPSGTYMYHDAFGGTPLYRILGLHGAFIVQPDYDALAAGAVQTPYDAGHVNDEIIALFESFGVEGGRFPGSRWIPAPLDQEYTIQEKIWLVSQVDPRYNALLKPGQIITSNRSLTRDVTGNWLPRYFTINGRSGFDLSDGEDVVPKNYIGEPTLLRVLNAGLAHHSHHIHGNHPMELSEAVMVDVAGRRVNSGDLLGHDLRAFRTVNSLGIEVHDNIFERDVWLSWPMQRRDMLLPLEVPPDIPYATPFGQGTDVPQFDQMVERNNNLLVQPNILITDKEPFPLRYVMHCHCEMATTAGGGNYPQGMVTHWEILGGVGGRAGAEQTTAQLP